MVFETASLAEGEHTVEAFKSLAFDEWNGRRRECQDKMASLFSTEHPLAPLSPGALQQGSLRRARRVKEIAGWRQFAVILHVPVNDTRFQVPGVRCQEPFPVPSPVPTPVFCCSCS